NIYQALKVPELWRFENGKLQINILVDGTYVVSQSSLHFPGLPLIDVIPRYLESSGINGRNATIKRFRNWVREQL
ncbi:MAG: Uma2 family endonuclease, partial [Sphaerospermopsis kisseleviana]